MTESPEHVITIEPTLGSDGGTWYRPTCSCGHPGNGIWDTREGAERSGRRHVDACAVAAYVQAGIVSLAEYLELTGVTIPPDPSGEYDGIIASLEGGAYTPTRQTIAAPVDIDSVMATLNWGQPLTDADANWPADASKVCAHICGGDHECDTRATGRLTYNLPSGGTRAMPICGPCHESEAPA